MAPKAGLAKTKPQGQAYKDKSKPAEVRSSNIQAAKGKYRSNQTKLSKLCYKYSD